MVFNKIGNWMSKTSQGLIESKSVLYFFGSFSDCKLI